MPMAGLARHLVQSVHLVAFAITCSACSFQWSSWSNITPKNLCVVTALMVIPPMVSAGQTSGVILPGHWGSGAHQCENPTSIGAAEVRFGNQFELELNLN